MMDMESLDIKSFVTHAINEVFDTMFSMEVVIRNGDSPGEPEGNQIVGSVSFAGEVMGSVTIYVKNEFARLMTAAMLDMELGELITETIMGMRTVAEEIGLKGSL